MRFWKKHLFLRAVLMLLLFSAGLALVFVGWRMTGQMSGLGLMLLGILLLLGALWLYNRVY